MPKFVVYEVWTKARVVEAETASMAYQPPPDPKPHDEYGMNLCNWHVVAVNPEDAEETDSTPAVNEGGNDSHDDGA